MTPEEKEIKENWQMLAGLISLMIFILILALLTKNKDHETKIEKRRAKTYNDSKIDSLQYK